MVNGFINDSHKADSFRQGGDNALVMGNVVIGKLTANAFSMFLRYVDTIPIKQDLYRHCAM